MRLTIPHPLPDLNSYINAERTNKFKAAKIKREATELCGWYVKKLKPIKGQADFTFTWFVPNQKKDPDNISFGAKMILDSLVKAGKLPNDNLRYIRSITHFFEIGSPKVTIDIEEC